MAVAWFFNLLNRFTSIGFATETFPLKVALRLFRGCQVLWAEVVERSKY
jgi:hypothetical protein